MSELYNVFRDAKVPCVEVPFFFRHKVSGVGCCKVIHACKECPTLTLQTFLRDLNSSR